jgi:hypothetical protein
MSPIDPRIHGHVVLLPICADTDPRRAEEPEPVLRFMRPPDSGSTPTNIDILLWYQMLHTRLHDMKSSHIHRLSRNGVAGTSYVSLVWDGGFARDPVSTRGWFVRLDPSVMQIIGTLGAK